MSTREEYRQLVDKFLADLTDTEHPLSILAFHNALRAFLIQAPAEPVAQQIVSNVRAMPYWERTGPTEAVIFKVREMREHLAALLSTGTDQTTTAPRLRPLGAKKQDLSGYFFGAGLTEQQRQCFSLRFEYGLPVKEIAKRIGVKHHSTVQQHIQAAKVKVELSRKKGKGR